MYDFRTVREHIEVYYNGEFLFTADNKKEAEEEIERMKQEDLS